MEHFRDSNDYGARQDEEPIDLGKNAIYDGLIIDGRLMAYISSQLKPLMDRIEKLEADRTLSIQTVQPFIIGKPMCNCEDK